MEKNLHRSALNMASRDSQIDKPQRERPKRAELPGVNIKTSKTLKGPSQTLLCFCLHLGTIN